MNLLRSVVSDTLNLLYPNVCVTCGRALPPQSRYLCTACLYDLPRTNFHREHDNPLAMTFWGRVRLEHAAAWFHYFKGSRYPNLIHRMKYMGMKEIGYEMGKMYARELRDSPFDQSRVIVPVPLHPRKQRKRGYNQSEWIARGMADVFRIPLSSGNLVRAVNTRTQTRKSRIERWKNVENVFKVRHPHVLKDQHILLVDDVVTTGATLESCASTLLGCPGTKVSLVTLGYADHW